MSTGHGAFRAAVEAAIATRDAGPLVAILADDVELRSPAVFRPYRGKETVAAILQAVTRSIEDFRYTRELTDAAGAALVFRARVGDKELEGIDLVALDDTGRVCELVVFIRPLAGLNAVVEEMGRQLG